MANQNAPGEFNNRLNLPGQPFCQASDSVVITETATELNILRTEQLWLELANLIGEGLRQAPTAMKHRQSNPRSVPAEIRRQYPALGMGV
jgi:hypothetical protein